jgi:hypothetical protein
VAFDGKCTCMKIKFFPFDFTNKFLKKFEEIGFAPHTYTNLKTNRLKRLFFAHPKSIEIYKSI